VDQFQNGDIEIFLISTKAGGLGLNLTAGEVCVVSNVVVSNLINTLILHLLQRIRSSYLMVRST